MQSDARPGASSAPVVAAPPRPRRPLDTSAAYSDVSARYSAAAAAVPSASSLLAPTHPNAFVPSTPRPMDSSTPATVSSATDSSDAPRDAIVIARPLKRARPAANPLQYGMSLLRNQFKAMSLNPPDGISVGLINDDIFHWRVMIQGPEDTIFEGGVFPTALRFPRDYPDSPPQMTFLTKGFWHPNVFADGRVCISILHEPSEDRFTGDEPMSEKWRPVLGVEQVVLSVLSMLTDPNCDSPANVDACVQFRNSYELYKKTVRAVVRRSQEELDG